MTKHWNTFLMKKLYFHVIYIFIKTCSMKKLILSCKNLTNISLATPNVQLSKWRPQIFLLLFSNILYTHRGIGGRKIIPGINCEAYWVRHFNQPLYGPYSTYWRYHIPLGQPGTDLSFVLQ